MKSLYIRQRIINIKHDFTVKDEKEKDVCFVKGSFMKIPKTYKLTDAEGNLVAQIIKRPLSVISTFYVKAKGQEYVTIKKELSFLKSRYTIDAAGIEVKGNWRDKNF